MLSSGYRDFFSSQSPTNIDALALMSRIVRPKRLHCRGNRRWRPRGQERGSKKRLPALELGLSPRSPGPAFLITSRSGRRDA